MLYKKIKKNTCRYYYHNLDDIIYMIYSSWHIAQNILKLVILGHLLPFHPNKNSKIKILKNEKNLLEILLFYTCVPKITITWCTVPEWDRQNFLSFWAFFCPFSPLTAGKIKILRLKKTSGDIIILHICTINDNHMMHGS